MVQILIKLNKTLVMFYTILGKNYHIFGTYNKKKVISQKILSQLKIYKKF
jgi:hypothetical protein